MRRRIQLRAKCRMQWLGNNRKSQSLLLGSVMAAHANAYSVVILANPLGILLLYHLLVIYRVFAFAIS